MIAAIAVAKGQSAFFRPGNEPVLCVYFELKGSYRVVCTAPGDLRTIGRLDGFVFGSVGLDAVRVTVSGVDVEFLGNDQFTDRRFFVAIDGDVKMYGADGQELIPDPIIATSE